MSEPDEIVQEVRDSGDRARLTEIPKWWLEEQERLGTTTELDAEAAPEQRKPLRERLRERREGRDG
jgi:hypothetical protein